MRKILLASLLALCTSPVFAADCETTIEANDTMHYNVKEITAPKSCAKFTVHMHNVGKMPKTAMGHDVVLTKTADAQAVALEAAKAGPAKDYVPDDKSRIIAHSKMSGPGETVDMEVDMSKLDAAGDYTFFCSFPGHFALMKGKFIVK